MIQFSDRAEVGRIKDTSEGYLIATARVARTGIQDYLSSELGLDGNKVVKVYRSADEVFSKDALQSLTRIPVTVNHPEHPVTADNWKDYAVGEVGDRFAQDGDWIVVNPMIKDSAAREMARTTHKEISMGYTAELRDADPSTGADYEMYNVRFNHLALVTKGCAGSQARIGDAQTWGVAPVTIEDKQMTVELKTVILGDKAVQVEDKDADTVAAILKDHTAVVTAKDTEIGRLTAELADAKSKVLTDAQVSDMVAAKVAYDKKFEAVKAKFGDEAVKDASEAMIDGMFRVIDKAVDDTGRNAFKDAKPVIDSEARIKAAQAKHLHLEAK